MLYNESQIQETEGVRRGYGNHGRYCQTSGCDKGDGLQGAQRRGGCQRNNAKICFGGSGGAGVLPHPPDRRQPPGMYLHPEYGLGKTGGLRLGDRAGFRKLAEPAGYQVDIVPLTQQLQKESRYDEYMLLHCYQGALFLGLTLLDIWMEDFKTCSTPAVLYDSCVKSNPAVTQVGIDNDEGMDMAVTRLKELGHQKIGYLSSALGANLYQAPRSGGPYGADPLSGAGDCRAWTAERHWL